MEQHREAHGRACLSCFSQLTYRYVKTQPILIILFFIPCGRPITYEYIYRTFVKMV